MQVNRTHEMAPVAGQVRFLSVAGAARLLGMSGVTLYRAIQAGEFPAIKVRGRYVIPSRALDAMEEAALSSGGVVDAAVWTVLGGEVA
jgi:excisionase family DNA binding protein